MSNMKYYFRVAASLLLICTVVSVLLAVVNGVTVDIIAVNEQKAKEDAIRNIYPALATMQTAEGEWAEGVNAVYTVYGEGETLIGYAVDLNSAGFGGDINMMVGIDAAGTVVGTRVISHSETPGLGSKATVDGHLAKYDGKNGEIPEKLDAVTGATISSKAIIAGINLALSLDLGGETV